MTDREEGTRPGPPKAGLAWRSEEFGVLLYDSRSDALYRGNCAARDLLRALQEGEPREQTVQRIARRCRVTREQVRRDVSAFLHFLETEGLAGTAP